MLLLLVAVPFSQTEAQHGKGDLITGQGFKGKKVKQRKQKEKVVKFKGRAGKAQRAQAKKAEERNKTNAKADKKLKDHHFGIQTPATQARILNNKKNTSESYKAKRQKIKRESHKPKNHRKP